MSTGQACQRVWAVILCVLCVCVCVYTQSAVCVYCLVCTVVCRPFLWVETVVTTGQSLG